VAADAREEVTGRPLYRCMAADGDLPRVGQRYGELGARTGPPATRFDISVDNNGQVHPEMGGISVAPDHWSNLRREQRPPALDDGTGILAVWVISEADLGDGLRYARERQSGEDLPNVAGGEDHGFIEPAETMSEERYQALLAATREKWRLVAG
jgi:hypothetical protein